MKFFMFFSHTWQRAGQPRINAGSRFPGCAAQPPLGTKLSDLRRNSVSLPLRNV